MILSINTSALQFALALSEVDGTLLTEHTMPAGKGRFGKLMPTLDFILKGGNFPVREVACVAAATGPGSFTGLRVGLSLAKGLCHALGVPGIGVSSLEAMANQLPYTDLPIIPILHSKKGEVFTARFTWNNEGQLIREEGDAGLKFDLFPSLFREPSLFVGNDYGTQAPLLKSLLGPSVRLAPPALWGCRASSVGSMALERFLVNDFDDPFQLNPVYLRPPDIRANPFSPLSSSHSPSQGPLRQDSQNDITIAS